MFTCNSGSMLAGNCHQLVAFPQFGHGKGNPGENTNDYDFGRENITGDQEDRFYFRAPSLLNIEVTAPYGHTGAYETLEEVVRHYNNPRQSINRLFGAQGGQAFANGNAPFCQLPQIAAFMQKNNLSCDDIYPDAYDNSIAVADYLIDARDGDTPAPDILNVGAGLDGNERAQVVVFLRALTDPCVLDRECMDPWIVEGDDVASFPDDKPLVATNEGSQEP